MTFPTPNDIKHLDFDRELGYQRVFMEKLIPCHVCQVETQWMAIPFGAPCCSHECTDFLWDDYFNNMEQGITLVRALQAEGKSAEEAMIEVLASSMPIPSSGEVQ